jgi:hypothetical protein
VRLGGGVALGEDDDGGGGVAEVFAALRLPVSVMSASSRRDKASRDKSYAKVVAASTTLSLWTSFDERWIELTLLDSVDA